MNYLSLFSGIGAPESALKNIGINYNLVGFSEVDKYAVKSYCEIHGVDESLNLGDITKIDLDKLPKDIDLGRISMSRYISCRKKKAVQILLCLFTTWKMWEDKPSHEHMHE